MDDVQQVEQIVDRLKKAKRSERSAIIDEYHKLVKSGLTLEAGLRAIEAATGFPPAEEITEDNPGALVGYLQSSRFPADHGVAAVPRIFELYLSLPEKARMNATRLLMKIPEREGALAVMELVRQHFHNGNIPFASFSFAKRQLHAEVYFPKLLDYAHLSDPQHALNARQHAMNTLDARAIWQGCLMYCEEEFLRPEQITSRGGTILAEYQPLKARLLPTQSQPDRAKNRLYIADRDDAEVLLKLLRFFPTDEVRQEISAALNEFRDPFLLCWTAGAALWLGLPVSQTIIETIAASDEARNPFYGMLGEFGQTALFPKQYLTKAAFAQSALVIQLAYPTQLGCVPDVIELTHVIKEKNEDEVREWFLFRFRSSGTSWARETDPAVWLAGWSGPFDKEEAPGETLHCDDMISEYESWDSKTPQEHLRSCYEELGKLRVTAVG